ncbi:FMRFamide-activated amiloride-sensitive sodium channel [Caerostris extrusa]|uniref:FMRFamide-activated amiloride-sensitive sodium channel n=1 Tax=Caerostris extrusa TaxID=172846 RepID=A0AAV4MXQ8_CAEEX|nr:FMRFamide-activated amiloride-sensitive sodium channel [Caerostris extrusa]
MIKLKVYYDTLEQLTYEQKPMFEDSEVLSQVGGQMGLWLGLSLAAMFECLENIVLLWHYRRQQSKETENH